MLIKNPITEIVYNYDYNYRGRQNIYDYWTSNRDELLAHVHKNRRHVKNYAETLRNFELKIRWSSFYGMLYRFYLKKYLTQPRVVIEFENIMITYGRKHLLHKDFIEIISKNVQDTNLFDLRGISLINYRFENTIIENVDFSNSALNNCVFKNVTFSNCHFDTTEFIGSQLINCFFDNQCELQNNDFTKTLINSTFECEILSPIILKATWKNKLIDRICSNSEYLSYTKVDSVTFEEHTIY